jgi:hypothetical protein
MSTPWLNCSLAQLLFLSHAGWLLANMDNQGYGHWACGMFHW